MSKQEYFRITFNVPILIYGYTEFSKKIASSLAKKSYQIVGYIDMKAKELNKDNERSIYLPEEVCQHFDVNNIVVVVCLQNIMMHIKVAERLHREFKINNIIFLSGGKSFDSYMASEMRKTYQRICLHEDLQNVFIPQYSALIGEQTDIDIIEQYGEKVCAWVPICMIYNGMKNEDNYWQIKNRALYEEAVQCYEDRNIILNRLYNEFFEYLLTGNGKYKAYINAFSGMTNRNIQQYWEDRVALFELYEEEYERGIDFFIETAACAEWNSNGYFNLKDGHHRVTYLHKKGHLFIPLLISRSDFQKYKNDKVEIKIRAFFKENDDLEVQNAELQYRFKGRGYFNTVNSIKCILSIWDILDRYVRIDKCTYLDATNMLGFFAINMKRMHVEHVDVVVKENREVHLLKLIMEMTYQDGIQLIYQDKVKSEYDIVFMEELNDDRLYHLAKKICFFKHPKDQEICTRMGDAVYCRMLEYFDGREWMVYSALIKNCEK